MTHSERNIAERITSMPMSAIKEMAMRAANVDGVASLAWGLPSFATPTHIVDAVAADLSTNKDVGKYTLPDGLPQLRALAAKHHRDETGVVIDPDLNVIVTAGNMQGVNAVLHAVLNPGDEVILTDPGFAAHAQQINVCAGNVVYWPLDDSDGWRLDLDALPDLVNGKTKAMILVTPSNPTGAIFPRSQLERAAEIAAAHGVWMIVDDPYHHFMYENAGKYYNPASNPAYADNTIYLYSFSKAHAMSGWRLGYMVVPEQLKRHILKVHNATLICAPHVSQIAGIAALGSESPHVHRFETILGERRRAIVERLDRVPHVFDYRLPEGAYYVFPRIIVGHSDSRTFALDLLESAKVAVTPGGAFGPRGEHHVRMAFCVDDDVIHRAFDRIEARYPA